MQHKIASKQWRFEIPPKILKISYLKMSRRSGAVRNFSNLIFFEERMGCIDITVHSLFPNKFLNFLLNLSWFFLKKIWLIVYESYYMSHIYMTHINFITCSASYPSHKHGLAQEILGNFIKSFYKNPFFVNIFLHEKEDKNAIISIYKTLFLKIPKFPTVLCHVLLEICQWKMRGQNFPIENAWAKTKRNRQNKMSEQILRCRGFL